MFPRFRQSSEMKKRQNAKRLTNAALKVLLRGAEAKLASSVHVVSALTERVRRHGDAEKARCARDAARQLERIQLIERVKFLEANGAGGAADRIGALRRENARLGIALRQENARFGAALREIDRILAEVLRHE